MARTLFTVFQLLSFDVEFAVWQKLAGRAHFRYPVGVSFDVFMGDELTAFCFKRAER
jgi:hypothetical protein